MEVTTLVKITEPFKVECNYFDGFVSLTLPTQIGNCRIKPDSIHIEDKIGEDRTKLIKNRIKRELETYDFWIEDDDLEAVILLVDV